jgi:hypothetical protein
MNARFVTLLGLVSFAIVAQTGCATPEQWATWRSHSSHFASGQHASFSVKNPGPEAEQVRPTDVAKSREQAWWGRQIPVASSQ